MPIISYTVQRNVPASNRSGGPENCRIAMVLFAHPKTAEPTVFCVNEDMIASAAGPDTVKQREVIERELKTVLSQMTAGAEFIPILDKPC
jgi:hypothetical protein